MLLRLYLQLKKSDIGLDKFYKNKTWQTPLLLSEKGEPFKPSFELIRVKNLLNSTDDMKTIDQDNVLPRDWIQSGYKECWQYSFAIAKNEDSG